MHQRVPGPDDGCRGSVVGGDLADGGRSEQAIEVGEVAEVRPSEPIDGLPVIPDAEELR
jgi:hypothetical protein